MESNTFKLNSEARHDIEILYAEPKTGEGNYGKPYFLYGVRKNNQEASFFATSTLHQKLSRFGVGSKLTIVAEEYAPNKFGYNVEVVLEVPKGTVSAPIVNTLSNGVIDSRTHDIHKQVCLKLAVDLVGDCMGILTDSQLVAVEANMKALLGILEAKEEEGKEVKEDLPF